MWPAWPVLGCLSPCFSFLNSFEAAFRVDLGVHLLVSAYKEKSAGCLHLLGQLKGWGWSLRTAYSLHPTPPSSIGNNRPVTKPSMALPAGVSHLVAEWRWDTTVHLCVWVCACAQPVLWWALFKTHSRTQVDGWGSGLFSTSYHTMRPILLPSGVERERGKSPDLEWVWRPRSVTWEDNRASHEQTLH